MKFIVFQLILLTVVAISWTNADLNDLLVRGTQLLLQAKNQVAALRGRATQIETAEKSVAVLVAETGILDPDLVVDAARLAQIVVNLTLSVDNLEKVLNSTSVP